MNIFLHELRAYRKSTIIWTCSLVMLIVILLSMFPAFSKDVVEFKKLLEGYPESLRKAIGLSVDNIGSILGFYSFTLLYVTLCGAMQAMNLGASILSKEVREKTADFLLTKPVTRTQIVSSKILAALTSLIITNIVYLIATYTMVSIVNTQEYDFKVFFMISITLFFLQLIFLALGILISVVISRIKSVLSISLGSVFGLFFIGALGSTTGENILRYFSPFKYFDTVYIMQNSSYEASFIIVAIGFITSAIVVAYLIYCKRDVHAV